MARSKLLLQTSKPHAVSRIVLGDVWGTGVRNCASCDCSHHTCLPFSHTSTNLHVTQAINSDRSDSIYPMVSVPVGWFPYGDSLGAMRQSAMVGMFLGPSLHQHSAHSLSPPSPFPASVSLPRTLLLFPLLVAYPYSSLCLSIPAYDVFIHTF